jgi:hypothetical protein
MDEASRTRTLVIDGMKGEGCVQKVTEVLGRVGGIRLESAKVGEAVVVCLYPAALGGARAALLYAGFRPRPLEYWGEGERRI